jgi:hypothetical protein
MKTEVQFAILHPIAFEGEESYEWLGISTCFQEGKLTALKTVVEHEAGAGHDEILSNARAQFIPLTSLIEYGCGLPVSLGGVQTRTVEPASPVSIGLDFVKMDAVLFRKVPMPPAKLLSSLTESVRKQITWLALGQKSQSVIERIKYYYMVLEQEERMTAQTYQPYASSQEAKYLRNAVSHPEIDDPRITKYLDHEIRATKIDPNNQSHIRFLEKKVSILQHAAEAIVNMRIPRWW